MNPTFKITSERLELNRVLHMRNKNIEKLIVDYKNLNCPYLSFDYEKESLVANGSESMLIHNDSLEMKFLIYRKIVKDFVGFCGIALDGETSGGKIFYILSPYHKGNGFAIESIKLLLKFAFIDLNLNYVKAEIPSNLKGAWKPVERAGMRYLGDFQVEDQINRFLLFKIDKKEYLNQLYY
jgi:RimJ/RimL family protein N-acetyltransferase